MVVVVIIKKSDYESKLDTLNSDHYKFTTANNKQTEKVKTKITVPTGKLKNKSEMVYKKLKCVKAYTSGRLYGLQKIHKIISDPALRPINSMCDTVFHRLLSGKIFFFFTERCNVDKLIPKLTLVIYMQRQLFKYIFL